MGPLALILLARGHRISGSDLLENKFTELLKKSGAVISIGHSAVNLPSEPCIVVYSSAISDDNPELKTAREQRFVTLRRGEMLAELASTYRRPVAISGSHGKTTITAMLAHILCKAGLKPGFMIGGKLISGSSSDAGNGDIFVTEADESDGSHTAIHPWLGIIPNIEDDHSWSVGGEQKLHENFRQFGKQSKKIIHINSPIVNELYHDHPDSQSVEPSVISFDPVNFGGYLGLDAEFAIIAAEKLGVSRMDSQLFLQEFPGVSRRMTRHFQTDDTIVIEDYAHHPTELECALDLIRQQYPDWHLRVVFQPHRYARLEKYFEQFAEQLRKADSVYITPVFAAWVETGLSNSKQLAEKIGTSAAYLEGDWQSQARQVIANRPKSMVTAIIGAGDIDQIIPFIINDLKMTDK